MNIRPARFDAVRALAVIVAFACPPALADATRALATPMEGVPHAWIVVADSGAAAGERVAARAPYEPGRRYARAGCVEGRVYWSRGGGTPPDCTSSQWIEASAPIDERGLRCDAARGALASHGWHAAGRLRQWDARAAQWRLPVPGERGAVECEDDRGRHGAAPAPAYAADGGPSPWAADPVAEISWAEHAERYTLYAASYVAWWHGQPRSSRTTWKDAQSSALAAALPFLRGTLTVLRHDWNAATSADAAAEGGMVLLGPTGDPARRARVDAAWSSTPTGGSTPLAETLDETARVALGIAPRYGLAAHAAPGRPLPSVPESLAGPARYRTPFAAACARADVLVLSAGVPAQDAGALRTNALGLGPDACRTGVPGACAGAFARAMDPLDGGRGAFDGRLGVAWLADAAVVGAVDAPGLRPEATVPDALAGRAASRVRERLQDPGLAAIADATPQIMAVTARGADAFSTWATASPRTRWHGGLRRVTGEDGVAAELRAPAPALRRVYTDVAGPDLAAAANALVPDNARLGAAELGLGSNDADARTALIRWVRGHDVDDRDGDGDRDEARGEFGAMIGAPAIVRYADGRTLAFAGSSDGILHAFGGTSELWAYVPRAFLARLALVRDAAPAGPRFAGLDGDVRVLTVDANADRRIDAAAGDRAVLLFGLRRGGRAYYAVEVSVPESPRLLWVRGPQDLPGLGQTWAAPVPVRLTIAGVRQSPGNHVVLLAGGHDPAQDRRRARSRDRVGAALYLVDAWSGELLWHARAGALGGRAPDVAVPWLDYAIAATPRALDLDGDGELDRAYVADTGGQVFRVEFRSGANRDDLARFVRLATLGGAGARDRRFYAEPDVSLVRRGPGAPYVAVALGSGFAPDPQDAGVADRLYSLRDVLPDPTRPSRDPPRVTDDDLPDATDVAVAGGRGWKRRLTLAGERILVGARTVDHRVIVPAWRLPDAPRIADGTCTLAPGRNRLYVVDVRDGRPRAFRVIEAEDREEPRTLAAAGVVPAGALVATAPPRDCRGDCRSRLQVYLGAERFEIDWPGSVVRSGWVERGRP